jgi:hypothetical protein
MSLIAETLQYRCIHYPTGVVLPDNGYRLRYRRHLPWSLWRGVQCYGSAFCFLARVALGSFGMATANTQSAQNAQRQDAYAPRTIVGAIYLGAALVTAAGVAWLFLKTSYSLGGDPLGRHLVDIALLVSPLIFLFACILMFLRSRLAYWAGLVAGLMALPWFAWSELDVFSWMNSWITLNGASPEDKVYIELAKLKILAVAVIVVAIVCSVLRLLPASWMLRRVPLRGRTWPAFATSFLVLAIWFSFSVTPYRIPLIVDAVSPEFRILHVEKLGMQYHETEISVYRDGKFWVTRNDRRLFQYQFDSRSSQGLVSQAAHDHTLAFAQSPELLKLHTGPAKALRSWHAEGWYVVTKNGRVLTFTSQYGTSPPKEDTDVFYEIEKLPVSQESHWAMRDVCLGFCYDPLAGLGFRYTNSHCSTQTDGTTYCR